MGGAPADEVVFRIELEVDDDGALAALGGIVGDRDGDEGGVGIRYRDRASRRRGGRVRDAQGVHGVEAIVQRAVVGAVEEDLHLMGRALRGLRVREDEIDGGLADEDRVVGGIFRVGAVGIFLPSLKPSPSQSNSIFAEPPYNVSSRASERPSPS